MSVCVPPNRHEIKAEYYAVVYTIAERVLKYVKENNGIAKTTMCSMIPQELFKKVDFLTHKVMENKEIIGAILKDTKLLEKVPLGPEAVEIMIYEMVISKKSCLLCECEGALIMRKYMTDIQNAFSKLKKTKTCFSMPEYARIHTIAISVDDALADLKCKGYKQIHYPSDISLNDYQALVVDLQLKQFLVDYHFKDLLVFPSEERPSSLEMFKKQQLFWQEKSSYVPVHVLSPEPGSVVIATPCKQMDHLVSVMENKGTIYAVTNDRRQFVTLKYKLENCGYKVPQVYCKKYRFRDVNPNTHPYDSAKYILVEPYSSRSGFLMQNGAVKYPPIEQHLRAHSLYQCNQLKHALSFPQVQRVVYTTTSVTEEENEYVVSEVLKCYSDKFRLVPAMPEWPARGLQSYEHKSMFFRTRPQEHLMNMVFIAVFERIVATEGTTEKVIIDQPGLKKHKMLKNNCSSQSTGKVSGTPTSIVIKKRKLKKHNSSESTGEKVVIDQPIKKRKMLKKNCLSERTGVVSTSIVRKKRKLKKHNSPESTVEN